MSTNQIKCPNCGHEFDIEHVLSKELELKYQQAYAHKLQEHQSVLEAERGRLKESERLFEEKKKKENELFAEKLHAEKQKITAELETTMRKTIHSDFEHKLRLLEQSLSDKEEKLKQSRKAELEFLQKEKALKDKEEAMEVQIQKQLREEREMLTAKIKEQLTQNESEKWQQKEQEFQLRLKEKEKQLEDQKKLVNEMQRKAEQGSMQLQGEVQELILEELLSATYPFDEISEVKKGVRGGDCEQIVRNQFGQEAGRIIYESKRTVSFSNDWIEKIKADMRHKSADAAVLVTQALPKGMERFGEISGVYVCTFAEVKIVSLLLRNALLKIYEARKSGENKGDKMVMLYDYLTSHEFSEQWKAIQEGFRSMKNSIQAERNAMEKLWKSREKQLEKVLLNAVHIRGSVEGIAGADTVNLNLLDEGEPLLLPGD
jgi:hypothetical protein